MKIGRTTTGSSRLLILCAAALLILWPLVTWAADAAPDRPALQQTSPPGPAPEFKRFEFDYELDAYYSNISFTIALTREPIPHLGERSEEEFYREMLTWALVPRFLYLEASINPLPYLGTSIRRHHPHFYDNAELSGSFNWIKALTAGFEEPWAVSALLGGVVDFDVPNRHDITGKGYSGYLASAGNYHIKDNTLVKDDWWEFEWKIKGDRKSPVKKLNWSFRIGTKLHGNPNITDIIYLSFRRSRVDYKPEKESLFNNSGFEYTYDMNRRGLHAIRHYFFVDKKWPYGDTRTAFSLALGFVWESASKYTGPLAEGRIRDDFQILLRPNIEF